MTAKIRTKHFDELTEQATDSRAESERRAEQFMLFSRALHRCLKATGGDDGSRHGNAVSWLYCHAVWTPEQWTQLAELAGPDRSTKRIGGTFARHVTELADVLKIAHQIGVPVQIAESYRAAKQAAADLFDQAEEGRAPSHYVIVGAGI